jgi:predicted restriction endonuclease
MNKRTKALQFSKATIQQIIERDEECFFCRQGYHLIAPGVFAYAAHDPMHVVNKSQGGLGVLQNGVLGCRYHHSLLDNGNKGLRKEMEQMLMDYLKTLYPGWTEESVTYNKWK